MVHGCFSRGHLHLPAGEASHGAAEIQAQVPPCPGASTPSPWEAAGPADESLSAAEDRGIPWVCTVALLSIELQQGAVGEVEAAHACVSDTPRDLHTPLIFFTSFQYTTHPPSECPTALRAAAGRQPSNPVPPVRVLTGHKLSPDGDVFPPCLLLSTEDSRPRTPNHSRSHGALAAAAAAVSGFCRQRSSSRSRACRQHPLRPAKGEGRQPAVSS